LTNATLQYLPFGSGNNAYQTFYDQEFDLKRDILSEGIITADLGIANDEYFTGMLGLGIDANIGNNLARFRSLKLSGAAKYHFSIFYTLMRDRMPVDVRMQFDQKSVEQASSMISITNGPTIGAKTPINPASNAFDGKLNAVVSEDLSLLKLLSLFTKIDNGKHLDDPKVATYEFEKLLIRSDEELLYQLDGEIRTAKTIDIAVCPRILTLKGKHKK